MSAGEAVALSLSGAWVLVSGFFYYRSLIRGGR